MNAGASILLCVAVPISRWPGIIAADPSSGNKVPWITVKIGTVASAKLDRTILIRSFFFRSKFPCLMGVENSSAFSCNYKCRAKFIGLSEIRARVYVFSSSFCDSCDLSGNINIWERFTKIAFNDIFYRVILFVFYSFNANFFNNKIIQLLLRIIIINNEGISYKKNYQKWNFKK